jgi:hypothetical protein
VIVGFVELGVHGGFIFLTMIGMSFWYLYRTSKIANETDEPLETRFMAYGLLISCVTYLITGLGTERFYCESFWWVLILPVCLHRLVAGEVAAKRALVPVDDNATNEDVQRQRWEGHAHRSPDGYPHSSFA